MRIVVAAHQVVQLQVVIPEVTAVAEGVCCAYAVGIGNDGAIAPCIICVFRNFGCATVDCGNVTEEVLAEQVRCAVLHKPNNALAVVQTHFTHLQQLCQEQTKRVSVVHLPFVFNLRLYYAK